MRDLQLKVAGHSDRALFAFDLKRRAVLLLGGVKRKHKCWSEDNVPLVDERFRWHLAEFEDEGADEGDLVR